MSTKNVKKPNKTLAVITYIIALIVIIGGWFIPTFGSFASTRVERMPFWFIPVMFNSALGIDLIPAALIPAHTVEAFNSFNVFNFNILGTSLNIVALLYIAYLVVTILAVIMLIPVLAGKKDKRTSSVSAYIVEVLALLVICALLTFSAYRANASGMANAASVTLDYHMPVALVGAALIVLLIIQSIANKKSLGVLKTLVFILSAVAFVCLFNTVAAVAVYLGNGIVTTISDLLNVIKSGISFAAIEVAPVIVPEAAITSLFYLIHPSELINILTSATATVGDKVLFIAVLLTVVLVSVNFILDLIGLAAGCKYNKNNVEAPKTGAKIFSLVRYLLVLVAAVTAIVTILVSDGVVGVYLYLVTLVTVIEVIISIIRVCRVKSLKKKNQEESEKFSLTDPALAAQNGEDTADEDAEVADQPDSTVEITEVVEQPDVLEEVAEEADEQPVISETVTEEVVEPGTTEQAPRTVIYNVQTIYNGPSDAFLDTLTNEEKVEFVKVFIQKAKSELPKELPEYEIGGNNDDFFPVIFIYLGKFRKLLSRELLGKIYKQLNNK